MPRIITLVAVLALTWAPSAFPASAVPVAPASPKGALVDPRIFFKADWDFMNPKVSPDGRRVGFLAVTQDHACLYQIDLASHSVQGLFNPGEGDVEQFWWLDDERILFCGLGRNGRTYFTLNIADGKTRPLYKLGKDRPESIFLIPGDPNHVFHGGSYRTDLVDTRNDSLWKYKTVAENIWSAVWSAEGEVLAGLSHVGDTWTVLWRAEENQPWQKAEGTGPHPPFLPLAMAQDDKHMLVIAFDHGDTSAQMMLDPATGQRTLIAQRPDRDVSSIVADPHSRALLAVKYIGTAREEIQYLDEAARKMNDQFSQSLPGPNHQIVDSSRDGAVCIVSDWNEKSPPAYYLFDRAKRRLSFLAKARQDVDPARMGTLRDVRFRTRDGLDENGFIVVPPESLGKAPWPLLVIPTEYINREMTSGTGFDGLIQFLACRGYAVAVLSVRGTDGFGRTFERAGDFQAGGKIVGDLEDGVGSLIQAGLVDPDRVAIYGTGFSGTLALRSASVSKIFHAVVAYVPDTEFDATRISEQDSNQTSSMFDSIQRAGGASAAYAKLRQFEPAAIIPGLSAQLLLVYPGKFGHEFPYYSQKAGAIRRLLASNHKPYEWSILNWPSDNLPAKAWFVELNASLFLQVADFLDRTLTKKPN